MFKVIITKEITEIKGNTFEVLAGLACYVEALKNTDIPEELIRKTVELGLKDKKEIENMKNEQLERKEQVDRKIEEILKKVFESNKK